MKRFVYTLVFLAFLSGCGGPEKPKKSKEAGTARSEASAKPDVSAKNNNEKNSANNKSSSRTPAPPREDRRETDPDTPGDFSDFGEIPVSDWETLSENDPLTPFKKRGFGAEIMEEQGDTLSQAYNKYPRITVNEETARENDLTVLKSKRLTLVTDLEVTPAIEKLSQAVAEAYPQLCEYFNVPEDDDWRLTAFLMKDSIPFIQAGFLPRILPAFKDGFAFNYDCWLYEQPSEYYRQHLLLHEMVHCFMLTTLGKTGPLWMTEGYAELFGMHDMSASPVTLGFMPPNNKAVPYCGRIRELRNEVAAGRGKTFPEVLAMSRQTFQNNEVYIWSWVLAWFLNNHPDTKNALQQAGRGLPHASDNNKITDAFLKALGNRLPEIEKHWLMYIASLDYHYTLEPMIFECDAGTRLPAGGKKVVTVQAGSGWQDTGITVTAGDTFRIRGAGTYRLENELGEAWPCEPGGVTLRYFMGYPRGMLLAAVCPTEVSPRDMKSPRRGSFFLPAPIGLNGTLKTDIAGTLMLRINDAPYLLERNTGACKAEITRGNY